MANTLHELLKSIIQLSHKTTVIYSGVEKEHKTKNIKTIWWNLQVVKPRIKQRCKSNYYIYISTAKLINFYILWRIALGAQLGVAYIILDTIKYF